MGFFSRFEGKMEDAFDGAADKMSKSPISPVQITKKAEKQMRHGKMVVAGNQAAPTLYTVLVNPSDDQRLFGYYPTLAGETETYLAAKAQQHGMIMDGQPLVRFVVDDALKSGKFEVIAEMVSAPIIAQLRAEEMQRYGLAPQGAGMFGAAAQRFDARGGAGYGAPQQPQYQQSYDYDYPGQEQGAYGYEGAHEPLPYVPQDEIDYSIDYGEYTFNSIDYNNFQGNDRVDSVPFQQSIPSIDASAASGLNEGANMAAPGVGFGAAAGMGAAAGVAAGAAAGGARVPEIGAGRTVEPANPLSPLPPEDQRRECLVDMASNRMYVLNKPHMKIGRESSNDIQIADINASRLHAEIDCDPVGTWTLTDVGSTNGTMVNNRTIAVQPLSLGDRITVGTTILMFTRA